MFTLEELIQPISLDDFMSFYKNIEALHLTGDEKRFDELFSWSRLNHLLQYIDNPKNKLKMVDDTNSSLPPPSTWLTRGMKGHTFVLDRIHASDPTVDRFCRLLSAEFNSAVGANCYASFPGKQGFNLHFDAHDVIILQISGTKHWKIFHPTQRHPVKKLGNSEPARKAVKTRPPYLECELNPGDVLYIPRGHWHYALPETPSLHLTVGITATPGLKYVRHVLEQISEYEELLRMDLPVIQNSLFGGSRPSEELTIFFDNMKKQLLGLLDKKLNYDSYVEYQLNRTGISVVPEIQLPQLAAISDYLTPDVKLTFPVGQKILLRFDEENSVSTVIARGISIDFENSIHEVFEYIFDGRETITAGELLESFDGLEWEQVKKIILTLFENRLLTIPTE